MHKPRTLCKKSRKVALSTWEAGTRPSPSRTKDIKGLQAIHFSTDRLVLVVQEQHRFASLPSISFADTLDENHVGMHATSTLHEFLGQVTEKLGKALKLRIQVSSFDSMCRMIAAGVGVGVVPESAALRCTKDLGVRIVPLTEPWSIRKRHILFRDESRLPNYAHALVRAISEHYQHDLSPDPV